MSRSIKLIALLLGAGTLLAACAHHSASKTASSATIVADGYDDREDAAYLRARLTSLRTSRGLSAAQTFRVADGYLTDAKNRILRGRDPGMALDDALQSAADEGERDLTYWAKPTPDLKNFVFPPDLLQERDVHIAIAVIRLQNPDKPPPGYEYYVLLAASASGLPQSGPAE